MKRFIFCLQAALLLGSCIRSKPYYTYAYIAEQHRALFSEFARKPGMEHYQDQIKPDKLGAVKTQVQALDGDAALEQEFRQRFFGNNSLFNGKSGTRQRGNEVYRTQRALDVLSEQRQSYKTLSDAEKKELSDFILNPGSVWIREIDLPFSDYDHVSSPYKNKSLVFYYFDSFDPETGFGVYYQTNAFYLRDAYDLSLDDIRGHRAVEYFCAPFFVQKTSSGLQLHLLSPANELTERKVFEVTRFSDSEATELTKSSGFQPGSGHLQYEMFKKYEYKLDNDFPFNLGSYKLKWYPQYDVFRQNEKNRLDQVYNQGRRQNNDTSGQINEFNELTAEALGNIDFMYPVKTTESAKPATGGWVYFGRIYIDEKRYRGAAYDSAQKVMHGLKALLQNETARDAVPLRGLEKIAVKDETFYKKSPFITGQKPLRWYYFNNETENLRRLLHRKRDVQPLEVVYLRNSPGKTAGSIKGEATPEKIYTIEALKLIGDFLWIKVRDVRHERTCTGCEFDCKKEKKNGRCKKAYKHCKGTCACHGAE